MEQTPRKADDSFDDVPNKDNPPMCHCGEPAYLGRVRPDKEKNANRPFWSCDRYSHTERGKKCKFFRFADPCQSVDSPQPARIPSPRDPTPPVVGNNEHIPVRQPRSSRGPRTMLLNKEAFLAMIPEDAMLVYTSVEWDNGMVIAGADWMWKEQ